MLEKREIITKACLLLKAAALRPNNLPAITPGAVPKASVAPCACTVYSSMMSHSSPSVQVLQSNPQSSPSPRWRSPIILPALNTGPITHHHFPLHPSSRPRLHFPRAARSQFTLQDDSVWRDQLEMAAEMLAAFDVQ